MKPDKTLPSAVSDLGLHCLPRPVRSGFTLLLQVCLSEYLRFICIRYPNNKYAYNKYAFHSPRARRLVCIYAARCRAHDLNNTRVGESLHKCALYRSFDFKQFQFLTKFGSLQFSAGLTSRLPLVWKNESN